MPEFSGWLGQLLPPEDATPSMQPSRYVVVTRRAENHDTVTLLLRPVDRPIQAPRPGQFTMLYAYGVGEVPVSVSGTGGADLCDQVLVQTIRAVGAVTPGAVRRVRPGDTIGVRGPLRHRLGGEPAPPVGDLLIVAGGIGLAPLRPAHCSQRSAQREVRPAIAVLVGARSTAGADLRARAGRPGGRRGADVQVTVKDRAADRWDGRVGLVTSPARRRNRRSRGGPTAFVCGPEIMMRLTARRLVARGVPAADRSASRWSAYMRCGHRALRPLPARPAAALPGRPDRQLLPGRRPGGGAGDARVVVADAPVSHWR